MPDDPGTGQAVLMTSEGPFGRPRDGTGHAVGPTSTGYRIDADGRLRPRCPARASAAASNLPADATAWRMLQALEAPPLRVVRSFGPAEEPVVIVLDRGARRAPTRIERRIITAFDAQVEHHCATGGTSSSTSTRRGTDPAHDVPRVPRHGRDSLREPRDKRLGR